MLTLCTLVLNEMEWLPLLYEQHKNWPKLLRWTFVESADREYAKANPEMVTDKGLSVDGTSRFLELLAREDDRVTYIPYGFSDSADPAQGKCAAREQYLRVNDEVSKTHHLRYFYVLDADEFVTKEHQSDINDCMLRACSSYSCVMFKQRHIWRSPLMEDQPLMSYEAVGGFFDIPHCRAWKYQKGLRYRQNHNTPESPYGILLSHRMKRYDKKSYAPYVVHMGYASSKESRMAKHRYYADRGERVDPKRSWYVDSRGAWFEYKMGDQLPNGEQIKVYDGVIPECFRS